MRKWFSIISALVLILVILAIAGVWQFKRVLSGFQITSFHYQLNTLNLHEVIFSELSFVHKTEAAERSIHLTDVSLNWYWQSWLSPRLNNIRIAQAQIVQLKAGVDLNDAHPVFSLPEDWSIPESFPAQINIQKITVKFPCAIKLCSFSGQADALKIKTGQIATGVKIKLKASPGEGLNAEQQFILDAVYSVEKNLPMLDAKFSVDDSINLQLNTHLNHKNEIYWLGSLKGNATYLSGGWLPYLKVLGIQLAPRANEQKLITLQGSRPKLSLDTEWRLALTPLINLPKTASAADGIKALTGSWVLDANFSEPLIITNLGEFSGSINIDVDINNGTLHRYDLVADMTVQHLVAPDAFKVFGVNANAAHLKIQSTMDSSVNLNALPVTFFGDTQGALQSNVVGRLLVDVETKKIVVEQLDVTAKIKQLKPVAGVQVENVSAYFYASGFWQPDKFELNLAVPNQVSGDIFIKNLSVAAKSTQFSTSKLNLSGNIVQGAVIWPQLTFITDAQLKGGSLQHPQVNAKAWYWQGEVQGSLADFEVDGNLGVGNSLVFNHHAKRKSSRLTLDWKIPDIFLLATNPFAEVLSVWPKMLSLSKGKLNANGNIIVNLEKNRLTSSRTEFHIMDVSGIYDTFIFKDISSQMKVLANATNVDISTDKLTVNNINKGFDFGPLAVVGKYGATWSKFMQGKFDLQYFSGSAMGGSLSVAAQQFDFDRAVQTFKLELTDINLASLLSQYSPGELSGTGLMSGVVPIEINAEGIRVEQGFIAADAPGGLLKMKSARADAIAKNQPSMKLVVDALNDFHYTALASHVNYNEKGKLQLSVRLEGRNPALENGRPVNLNVNLEEDVPAMLASIQLSSKVSDIVKKRLQSRVQKK